MKTYTYLRTILGIVLIAFFAISCEDQASKPDDFLYIRLNRETVKMDEGEQLNLSFTYLSEEIDKEAIKWVSGNPEVATVHVNSDKTCVVTGVSVGTSVIKVLVEGTDLISHCVVNVNEGGIIKILAIGNSFSEDAVENYLYDLARAAGKTVIIGNMYIGGCSLETHVENSRTDAYSYSYRKIDKDGNKTTISDYSLSAALDNENWHYISMQQASPNSGQYETYEESLPALYEYVKSNSKNTQTKYILHQTWAYQQNSTHSGFANYNNSQTEMYEAIMEATRKAAELVDIDIVIPAGTAIQNGRTSIIGDNFCRDGYHLNEAYGRFTAACTWFEKIFDMDVTTNSYVPDAVSGYYAEIAKAAAHAAVLSPYSVTELTGYKDAEARELTSPVYVNFNREAGIAPYQGLTSFSQGSSLANLFDSEGNMTGASLTILSRFTGSNNLGVTPTTIDWIPDEIAKYAFYGDNNYPTGVLQLANLVKSNAYRFTFFGSRQDSHDNRETAYKIIGETEETVYLDCASNGSETVTTSGIRPDSDGNIRIEVSAGPNNTNSARYYYLNVMRISPAD